MNRRAISLLEILIASGIMVAAMVPLWGLMGTSHKQVTLSADEIRVSQLAVEILEQIENKGWVPDDGPYNIAFASNSLVTLGNTVPLELQIGSYPAYLELAGQIEVERYPPAPNVEVGKVMTLIMNYKTREKVGEEEKTHILTTFVSRY